MKRLNKILFTGFAFTCMLAFSNVHTHADKVHILSTNEIIQMSTSKQNELNSRIAQTSAKGLNVTVNPSQGLDLNTSAVTAMFTQDTRLYKEPNLREKPQGGSPQGTSAYIVSFGYWGTKLLVETSFGWTTLSHISIQANATNTNNLINMINNAKQLKPSDNIFKKYWVMLSKNEYSNIFQTKKKTFVYKNPWISKKVRIQVNKGYKFTACSIEHNKFGYWAVNINGDKYMSANKKDLKRIS